MGATEIIRKQGPHLTPVVMLGSALALSNLSVFLISTLREMQVKARTVGLDMFDFSILLAGMLGSVALSIIAFMNQRYGKYQEEKEEERKRMKQLTETEWIKQELEKANQKKEKA